MNSAEIWSSTVYLTVVILAALLIMRILTLYALLFCTLSKLVLRDVFPSLIVVSLEGLDIPGWNRKANKLKESARFWHQLWTDSGCPSSGVLFQIKRNAKHRFKYEVRRLKRRREHIIRDNIGNALSHSRHKDFWKEVRKLSRSTRGSRSNAPVIDGLSDPFDISHAFSSKLKDILNSHHLFES